jgi:pyridoxamine 5'-phosphate oxidase
LWSVVVNPDLLPNPLPADPMPLVADWFRQACDGRVQRNPDSMVLATATRDGRPAARVVLLKALVTDPGYVVFYTNYDGRKGAELAANPRAAAVLHWDALERQVRLEGPIRMSPAAESDAYFATRARDSQVGAWASLQSQPLASRELLIERVAAEDARFAGDVPRPPRWGGFRLWPDTVELWVAGAHRIHDRAQWKRDLTERDASTLEPGPWRSTRLYP